jgi:hypothetical protein
MGSADDGKSYAPLPTRDTTQTHPNDSASVFFKHGFGALRCTTQRQLRRLSNPFQGAEFLAIPAGHLFSRRSKLPFLQHKLSPEFCREKRRTGGSPEESRKTMRARPEVRDILIAHKLRYWSLRAQYPTAFPNCSPSRARRNLLRLLARYPDLCRRMRITIASAYPPL